MHTATHNTMHQHEVLHDHAKGNEKVKKKNSKCTKYKLHKRAVNITEIRGGESKEQSKPSSQAVDAPHYSSFSMNSN